jgi:hypothetical protein
MKILLIKYTWHCIYIYLYDIFTGKPSHVCEEDERYKTNIKWKQ